MRSRRNAIIGAAAWWFASRWVRHQAARTVAVVPGVGDARGKGRGRVRAIGGALTLVGVLAVGFVLWRKLLGKPKGVETPPPSPPEPLRPAPAPVETAAETPPAPTAA